MRNDCVLLVNLNSVGGREAGRGGPDIYGKHRKTPVCNVARRIQYGRDCASAASLAPNMGGAVPLRVEGPVVA